MPRSGRKGLFTIRPEKSCKQISCTAIPGINNSVVNNCIFTQRWENAYGMGRTMLRPNSSGTFRTSYVLNIWPRKCTRTRTVVLSASWERVKSCELQQGSCIPQLQIYGQQPVLNFWGYSFFLPDFMKKKKWWERTTWGKVYLKVGRIRR